MILRRRSEDTLKVPITTRPGPSQVRFSECNSSIRPRRRRLAPEIESQAVSKDAGGLRLEAPSEPPGPWSRPCGCPMPCRMRRPQPRGTRRQLLRPGRMPNLLTRNRSVTKRQRSRPRPFGVGRLRRSANRGSSALRCRRPRRPKKFFLPGPRRRPMSVEGHREGDRIAFPWRVISWPIAGRPAKLSAEVHERVRSNPFRAEPVCETSDLLTISGFP